MLNVTVDVSDLNRLVAQVGELLPETVALAMNRTTEETQARIQQEIHAKLAVRSAQSATYLERMVKIRRDDRASKSKLQSAIRVEGPTHKPNATDALTRHIDGHTSTKPGTALDAFFIPAHATRPTRTSIVPRAMYPKNLRLMDRRDVVGTLHARRTITRTGKAQIKGKQRTFVLTEKGGGRALGVYQREGPNDIQLLWFYARRVTTPKRIDFYGIATRHWQQRFPVNMQGMLANMFRRVERRATQSGKR